MTLPIFPNLKTQAWNSTKTQRWNTIIKTSGAKKRKTMTTWAYPEWTIECSYTVLTMREIEQVAGFLSSVKGQLLPFLWLDMEDYKQSGTSFGAGNGRQQRFQLLRSWRDLFFEPALDIVPNTLVVYQDSDRVNNFVLEKDGVVYFPSPPAAGTKLTADFYYYWRVACADDETTWEIFWENFYKLNKFKVVTV